MLVIEIDSLDPEAPQAAFASGTNIIRLTVYCAGIGISRVADEPKFRGEYDLIPAAANRSSNQLFIGIWAVRVGRIKKVDSEFQGAMDSRDRFIVVTAAVELRTCPCIPGPEAETVGPLRPSLRVFMKDTPAEAGNFVTDSNMSTESAIRRQSFHPLYK